MESRNEIYWHFWVWSMVRFGSRSEKNCRIGRGAWQSASSDVWQEGGRRLSGVMFDLGNADEVLHPDPLLPHLLFHATVAPHFPCIHPFHRSLRNLRSSVVYVLVSSWHVWTHLSLSLSPIRILVVITCSYRWPTLLPLILTGFHRPRRVDFAIFQLQRVLPLTLYKKITLFTLVSLLG